MDGFDLTKFDQGPLLGEGCFGEAYQYRWKGSGENPYPSEFVAVKIIECPEPKVKEREIGMMQFTHPNIVTLYGWREDQKILYLVMELCNENLKIYLRRFRKGLDENQTRYFCLQLAEGLEYLHSQDCAHRDLKPVNVLVAFSTKIDPKKDYKKITLKLADFGLAKMVGDKESKSTRSVVGNKRHAAPEIIQLRERELKEGKYDAKAADVFSLGTIFQVMMTGEVPFSREQLLQQNVEIVALLNKSVPFSNLRPLLINMLAWQPDQRYKMSAVANDNILSREKKERSTINKLFHGIAKMITDPNVLKRQAKIGVATNHTLIVLVGPSGAGKTSTILHLMGQKEVEKSAFAVSKKSSTTRETLELRLKIDSDNPDLQHITLGIVDTPGLDDTEGKDQDAKNMACMETFLNKHESLQPENGIRKYPNLVLFVIKGDGNRDIGKKSQFAKCLKQLLCKDLHLTDGKNLIIVLTHALSIEHNVAKWKLVAEAKKKAIQDFVHEVKGWKNVPVVLLDNDPPPSMKKTKDWTMFADGTKQPLNLFNCIANEVLGPKGDIIGKLAIREYFQGLHDANTRSQVVFKVKATKRKSKKTEQENKFYKYLQEFEFPESSEEESNNDSDDDSSEEETAGKQPEVISSSSTNNQTIAQTSQNEEVLARVEEKEEGPESDEFEDADNYEQSVAPPIAEYHDIAGHVITLLNGYNVERNQFSNSKIFHDNAIDPRNYFEVKTENKIVCTGTKDKKQLKTMSPYEFASEFNVDSITVEVEIGKIEVTREFQAMWHDKKIFASEFLKDLRTMQRRRYNRNVSFVKKPFEEFFEKYGQTLVVSSRIGGRAIITFSQTNQAKTFVSEGELPEQLQELLQSQFGVKQLPNVRMYYVDDPFVQVLSTGNKVNVNFVGGLDRVKSVNTIPQWKDSLKSCPEYLIGKENLVYFHDLVKKMTWLEDHEELAENLQYAYEDMYAEGRVAVTERDEAKDIGVMRGIQSYVPHPQEADVRRNVATAQVAKKEKSSILSRMTSYFSF